MKSEVKIWSPATVANLNVGFDTLGCALAAPGEIMKLKRIDDPGRVVINCIEGADLDLNPENNVASVAAKSLLNSLGNPCGIEIEIQKTILPGSGIGSSASSAAAAVVGVNELLQAELRLDELIPFALDGEFLASGARHADNIAPAIMGGLVLCPPQGAFHVLPVPPNWHVVILHPQVPVRTLEAREVLPVHVSLAAAVEQSAWLGSFVASCFEGDGASAALALKDLYIGPYRSALIPHFDSIREIAMERGARAGGISGSGPSTFWIALNSDDAQSIADGIQAFMSNTDIDYRLYSTQIAPKGAHLIQ